MERSSAEDLALRDLGKRGMLGFRGDVWADLTLRRGRSDAVCTASKIWEGISIVMDLCVCKNESVFGPPNRPAVTRFSMLFPVHGFGARYTTAPEIKIESKGCTRECMSDSIRAAMAFSPFPLQGSSDRIGSGHTRKARKERHPTKWSKDRSGKGNTVASFGWT